MAEFARLLKIAERGVWLCVSDDIEFQDDTDNEDGDHIPLSRGGAVFISDTNVVNKFKSSAVVIPTFCSTVIVPLAGYKGKDRLIIQVEKIIVGDIVVRFGVGRVAGKTFFAVQKDYHIISNDEARQ